ncbi:MAG TPA: hypothetical protein VK607_09420 [Kofleriaceae bacterium]|nr:hypothetical protein [Kofleriaceae bacterium]
MVRLAAVVMSRALPVAAGVAVAGCAQIAGIHDTTGDARPGNSLAVTRMSIGATIGTSALDLTGLSATYFVTGSDGATIDRVTADPDPAHQGAWTTKLRKPAPVQFTLPDVPAPFPRLFAFPSADLSVLYGVLEHPHPSPAPDGATFTVTAPLDAAPAIGELFQTYVVGAWLARNFAAAELTLTGAALTPPAFSFAPVNSVPGRPQLDLVTRDDAFLILRYLGTALTGFAEAGAFDQTGADTAVTTGMMAPVAADQTLDMAIAPLTLAGRYTAVRPEVATLAINWSLVAAPGYRIASNAGPVLQSGALTMTDVGLNVKYGNPFAMRGWNTVLTVATSESRVYMPAGPGGLPTPITLFAGMNQFVEPPVPSPGIDMPALLPVKILFGQLYLDNDGLTVKQPTGFVDLTIQTELATDEAAQATTLYNLQVFELVVNATATALERRIVIAAAGSEPTFALPPELFQVGHSYTVRALVTHGGYPQVGDGDFLARDLPLAQSYLDSGVFTVMP